MDGARAAAAQNSKGMNEKGAKAKHAKDFAAIDREAALELKEALKLFEFDEDILETSTTDTVLGGQPSNSPERETAHEPDRGPKLEASDSSLLISARSPRGKKGLRFASAWGHKGASFGGSALELRCRFHNRRNRPPSYRSGCRFREVHWEASYLAGWWALFYV
jgi:hypothetical protein